MTLQTFALAIVGIQGCLRSTFVIPRRWQTISNEMSRKAVVIPVLDVLGWRQVVFKQFLFIWSTSQVSVTRKKGTPEPRRMLSHKYLTPPEEIKGNGPLFAHTQHYLYLQSPENRSRYLRRSPKSGLESDLDGNIGLEKRNVACKINAGLSTRTRWVRSEILMSHI